MTKKLWGGRFNKETHPLVEQYTASITFDCQLAQEDILGSLAHAAMLAHCGLISDIENQQIKKGLQQISKKIRQGEVAFQIQDEDIHMNIERLLFAEIGDIALKLHTARSRNDQVALDLHLYLRKQIVMTVDLLVQLQQTLVQMAANHQKVIIPGYTHLQRAQPIYLAQHWLAYAAMFERDIARLRDLYPRVNLSPLGACALAGTTLPIDREWLARELDFDGTYVNTLDAVSDRDFVVEFLASSALIAMHLSRLSEELILWSSQEFDFIRFDDAFCTGSSMMPQKKNPDVAELCRGKTGRIYGALFSLLTVLKGLPLAYNKDLQEDKEALFDTVKTVQTTLAIYIPLLNTLEINPEQMHDAATKGYLNATALAEHLVQIGIPFRTAHEITGKMVAFALNQNHTLEELSLNEMQEFAPMLTESVFHYLNVDTIANACQAKENGQLSLLDTARVLQQQKTSLTQQWVLAQYKRLAATEMRFEVWHK